MESENEVVNRESEPQSQEKILEQEPSNPSNETLKSIPKEPPELASRPSAANEQILSEQAQPADTQNGQPIEEPSQPVVEPISTPTPAPVPATPTPTEMPVMDRKKEEDKLTIYKALAIKLKKELVKVKNEFQKFQADKEDECRGLNDRVETLEKNLAIQSETSASTIATLEATHRNLKQQLASSEQDLCNLQENFENYKNKAQQIMQQTSLTQPQCNKPMEDERLKQLRELNDDQVRQIKHLNKQLNASAERSRDLEMELIQLQEKLVGMQSKLDSLEAQQLRHDSIQRENDGLKIALKQFRTKLREPGTGDTTRSCDSESKHTDRLLDITPINIDHDDSNKHNCNEPVQENQNSHDFNVNGTTQESYDKPSTLSSNSSSQISATGSSQLSVKPPIFEITSRSSAIEDARIQIDSLTKAYLDSENTNALLSDQVNTLKQEIRRLQLASERIELADNLEYLKNIVLKFLSLDGSQAAQKQRLVPVLSTVLKLSSDETMLLNSTAMASDKNSLASSFFKL